MTEGDKKLNIVDVQVKEMEKHMVVADYRIVLQSDSESVSELIKKIPEIKKHVQLKEPEVPK